MDIGTDVPEIHISQISGKEIKQPARTQSCQFHCLYYSDTYQLQVPQKLLVEPHLVYDWGQEYLQALLEVVHGQLEVQLVHE